MILDEFELLKKLGEGAFATVWAARRVDAPPNASGDRARKLYAVKHLKAATDPATGQDLLTTAEFRSLRAIPRHPNVLRPVQVARERGQVFLVTEWCESDVLKTLEAAKARGEIGLPESSVAGVGRGLLRALAHCHAHGWAHRDVKPENILIADGAVRLADFGEAAETSAESGADVSLRETYVGTRWYRAPEQFLPRGVSFPNPKAPGNAHASDVWAAGCVMGECLLGRALFRGAGAGDMLRKIAELVGEDARAPTPRSVRDAWAEVAGSDCSPRGPGRFEETFNVRGHGVSNECLALLREMLRVDPARRITAARAAEHPFFAKRAETRLVDAKPPDRRTDVGGGSGSIPDARG
jgi:protein kinase